MKKIASIICLLILALSFDVAKAQEPATIKVKREQNLVKIYFDNSDYKLIPIDRFGNQKENEVKSYKLWIKGIDQPFLGYKNSLSSEMVQALKKLKKATKIFFTEINVMDDSNHLINLPDVYEVWFPDCKNCGNKASKR
ncbi:MAG: hypothetical protein H0W61_13795 [Bacteroidetes bacterium]|nr:hypothetical protein [Bacteroidota bacterium]